MILNRSLPAAASSSPCIRCRLLLTKDFAGVRPSSTASSTTEPGASAGAASSSARAASPRRRQRRAGEQRRSAAGLRWLCEHDVEVEGDGRGAAAAKRQTAALMASEAWFRAGVALFLPTAKMATGLSFGLGRAIICQ
jgi:hypothetical protein